MVILRYDGDLDFDREFQEFKQQETKKGKKKTLEELKAFSESFKVWQPIQVCPCVDCVLAWKNSTCLSFIKLLNFGCPRCPVGACKLHDRCRQFSY
jgi:hypothetical protein